MELTHYYDICILGTMGYLTTGMKRQATTPRCLALVNSLLKSITATMVNHGLVVMTFLSSLLMPQSSRPLTKFLKLDVGRSVLVCISFGS
jgi:hypothetical protein